MHCRRHNKVLLEAFSKTLDVSCEPEVAWALNTKNGLQNIGGFTPNHLVFGHIVNTSSILTYKL